MYMKASIRFKNGDLGSWQMIIIVSTLHDLAMAYFFVNERETRTEKKQTNP